MNTILTPEIQDIHEQIGDEHILTSIETPMLATAFDKSDIDKIDDELFRIGANLL
jgi:hypothetical protein